MCVRCSVCADGRLDIDDSSRSYVTQIDYERIDLPDMRYEIGLMLDDRKLQLMKEGRIEKDESVTSDEWSMIRI